jgi:hypothetical protein
MEFSFETNLPVMISYSSISQTVASFCTTISIDISAS